MHEIGKWTFVVRDSPEPKNGAHVILVVTWILGSGVDPKSYLVMLLRSEDFSYITQIAK